MSKLQRASRAVTGRITKIMVYILIVIVVIFFAQRSFAIGREVFSEEGVEPEPGTYLTVTILPDDSVGDIADKLLEVGLIRNT